MVTGLNTIYNHKSFNGCRNLVTKVTIGFLGVQSVQGITIRCINDFIVLQPIDFIIVVYPSMKSSSGYFFNKSTSLKRQFYRRF